LRKKTPILAFLLLTAAPGIALADAPDCVAHASAADGPTLQDCLSSTGAGARIDLVEGVHRLSPVIVERSLVLRGAGSDRTAIASIHNDAVGPAPELEVLGGLEADSALLTIRGAGVQVEVEGVSVRPRLAASVATGEPFLRGRAFAVQEARLELVDVVLQPWDHPGIGGVLRVARGLGELPVDDGLPGGALVHADSRAAIVLRDVQARNIDAPALAGSVLFVNEFGSRAALRGATIFERIRSRAGAIVTYDEAEIVFGEPESEVNPIFRQLVADFGGVAAALEGGLWVNGGDFIDNGERRGAGEGPLTRGGVFAALEDANIAIRGGTFARNQASLGGAIYTHGADIDASDGRFEDNGAAAGGHIWTGHDWDRVPQVFLRDSVFLGGTAAPTPTERDALDASMIGRGGAFYMFDGLLTLARSQLADNTADGEGGEGGAVFLHGVRATIRECSLGGNRAERGGAIAAINSANVTVTDSELTTNEATSGGAIHGLGSALTVRGTTLDGNRATTGGHVRLARDVAAGSPAPDFAAETSTFRGGRADIGGAVAATEVALRWTDIDLIDHEAQEDGGALWLRDSPDITIARTRFDRAIAVGRGGGVFVEGGRATLSDVTFASCASADGAAVFVTATDQVTLGPLHVCDDAGTTTAIVALADAARTEPAILRNASFDRAAQRGGPAVSTHGTPLVVSQSAFIGGAGPAVHARSSADPSSPGPTRPR